jgi:GT2 family glycosyltransferase
MTERPPRILTVILNWNQPGMTIKCIEHVRRQEHPSTVLVVDNGSKDDSVARLRALGDAITLIALPTNAGFAGGMNVGLQVALDQSFDFVWLLNNDACGAPDSLTKLAEALLSDPDLVIVGPTLVHPDGRPQATGARLLWTDGTFEVMDSAALVAGNGDDRYLVGAAPLVRVEALRRVGLFLPEFFAYMEDADLGLRLNKVGRLGVVPEAIVVHDIGGTSGGYTSPFAQHLMFRNMWLCLSHNAPPGSRLARWCRYSAAVLRAAEQFEVTGHPNVARGILSGLSAARAGRFGAPPASVVDPAPFESFLGAHPTRYRRVYELVATAADGVWALGKPWRILRQRFAAAGR